ncbi:MAG: hypothetical protein ACRDF0_09310 [Candidatus Limnocylindria bacterium]
MEKLLDAFAARLARLGLPMEGESLARALSLAFEHSDEPQLLHDLVFMTICVEAYRRPESDVPVWV